MALDALVAGVVVLYGLPILPVMADGWRLVAVSIVSVAMGAALPWRGHRPLTVFIALLSLATVHLLLGAPVIPADVLLANILAEPLVTLAPSLAALVKPGGQLVLSGLLTQQAPQVAMPYQPWFDIDPVSMREDWARLSGRRRA